MGLKTIAYGLQAAGKTAFAVTMAEVGNIGVIDSEERWQWYTEPHPTVAPRKPSEAAIKAGAPADVYANPRIIRRDKKWLPKSDNVIWLVQTMDPMLAWTCSKIWANDPSIVGQVRDSASVLWDMLQDTRETVSANGKELGGLSWAPVKKVDRRMIYTLIESGQHFILNAHKQEIMDKEMHVIGSKPWVEKRSPHWVDLILQFARGSEDKVPKCRIEEEKILGGLNDALAKGTVVMGPTFKQILELAGGARAAVTAATPLSTIDSNTKALVNETTGQPVIQGS